MKRSWFSILAVSVVLGLLTVFVGLQYRWLTEASEAERERMQKRVETDSARLAEDFNREMQGALFNFQTSPEMWEKSDWSEFNERYDFWKQRTTYPELIREIYFYRKSADAKPLRYDAAARAFHPTDSNETLEGLRAQFAIEKSFRPFYEKDYALVLPVHESERKVDHIILSRAGKQTAPFIDIPDKYGWVVVLLDEKVIKERILPELAAKYFPEKDYSLRVTDKSEQTVFTTAGDAQTPDATAQLFNMSPDKLMFFASREMMPRGGEMKLDRKEGAGVVFNQRIESHTFSRTESSDGKSVKIELQNTGEPSSPRVATMTTNDIGGDRWTLAVQHATGSIDAYVRGERNKSFLIGLGIYLLLVGSIAAILLSAMRSKRFAQRQIDFVSSVSHEFRTPLAVIYSAGENLADGVTKDDVQVSRYGNLIKGEGKKLSGMVEQILEFAGANSGRQKYKFARTDVAEIVRDAIDECRPLIESNGFEFEENLLSAPVGVSADRAALSSAIQNLIANSVKYSNGSKWIRITTSNGGGTVKIAVEDNGIGISSDELRRIFEPFYRVREVVDAQISGNGLGLNLVKKIVEAHGGRVSAASTPGKGSTFTIEIPQA